MMKHHHPHPMALQTMQFSAAAFQCYCMRGKCCHGASFIAQHHTMPLRAMSSGAPTTRSWQLVHAGMNPHKNPSPSWSSKGSMGALQQELHHREQLPTIWKAIPTSRKETTTIVLSQLSQWLPIIIFFLKFIEKRTKVDKSTWWHSMKLLPCQFTLSARLSIRWKLLGMSSANWVSWVWSHEFLAFLHQFLH